MGCGTSKEKPWGITRNRKAKVAARDSIDTTHVLDVMLLGLPNSGKSTLLKQLKLQYLGGYTISERQSFKEPVFSNIHQSMRSILSDVEQLDLALDDQAKKSHIQAILQQPAQVEGDILPRDIGNAIQALWNDTTVQAHCDKWRGEKLSDAAIYYFDNINRISAADYIPNGHDILRLYTKSSDATETVFSGSGRGLRMIEPSTNCENMESIPPLAKVAAIIFFVDLSNYDQLRESVALFESISHPDSFIGTCIVFLNKIDIFKETFHPNLLKACFPDYEGSDDYRQGINHLIKLFNAEDRVNQVYFHVTCGLDPTLTRATLSACEDMLLYPTVMAQTLL